MLKLLNENYYIDLDEVEKYLDMSDEFVTSGETEVKINLIKFELVKLLLDVILSENVEFDEKLGLKSTNSNVSIPFRLAFNSLLNKKLINHY